MLWIGRKKLASTALKNNIGAYKRPLSVSETITETKINNQLKILKEQAKQLFDDGKGDFSYGGRFTQGASYPQLPHLSVSNTETRFIPRIQQ